ncbi:MAG: hypothetical protein WCO55_00455 [Candidatus Falkowbacteria bacterium]
MTIKKKKSAIGKVAAIGAGVSAAYYLMGPNAKKNQKKAAAWMTKMEMEVGKQLANAKIITDNLHHETVDTISAAYAKQYKAQAPEIKKFAKKLKNDWQEAGKLAEPTIKQAKKTVKEAVKAVKKAAASPQAKQVVKAVKKAANSPQAKQAIKAVKRVANSKEIKPIIKQVKKAVKEVQKMAPKQPVKKAPAKKAPAKKIAKK